jgi:hypothetical protein
VFTNLDLVRIPIGAAGKRREYLGIISNYSIGGVSNGGNTSVADTKCKDMEIYSVNLVA